MYSQDGGGEGEGGYPRVENVVMYENKHLTYKTKYFSLIAWLSTKPNALLVKEWRPTQIKQKVLRLV